MPVRARQRGGGKGEVGSVKRIKIIVNKKKESNKSNEAIRGKKLMKRRQGRVRRWRAKRGQRLGNDKTGSGLKVGGRREANYN
jgi:hypothetical protein